MYNDFYGLSSKPFESLPDPRFLFLTAGHKNVINSVMEAIKNNSGFISIIGEVGTGKTTLVRYLLGKLEGSEKRKTALIFHPTITFNELLENILLELDLEVIKDGKVSLLSQFDHYLTAMNRAGETLIVIIDEAQDLSTKTMEELGVLPNLLALQIIFVGQPEFENKLNSLVLGKLRQRIRIRHQIRTFSEEEARYYIDYRLRLVRSSSSERFTPKAVSRIYSFSKGVPRTINILCDNAFLRGYSLSQKKIDVNIIGEVIKDMQGPDLAKESRFFLSGENFLFSKTSLIILAFLCLGGSVFLIDRYVKPTPAQTSLPQKITEQIGEDKTHQPNVLKPTISEFPETSPRPDSPAVLESGEDNGTKIVVVKRGYTLSALTRMYYGTLNLTLIDFVLDLNPEIANANLILPDQKIKIPNITKDLLAAKSTDNSYQIRAGTFRTTDFIRFYDSEPILKGREVKIVPRKVSPRETWYRVVVGPFSNKEECLKVIDQLEERGLLPAFGGILKSE